MSKLSLFDAIKRKAFERNEDALRSIRQYGILSEDEISDVMGRLKDASAKLNDEDMLRLTHDASLNHFLTDDQRFKTQFERTRSSGTYNPSRRADYEEATFGTNPMNHKGEAAIYGLARDVNTNDLVNQGYGYGTNKVYLKPEVRYRATFNIGDSFSDKTRNHPTPFDMAGMSNLADGDFIRANMRVDDYKLRRRQDLLNAGKTDDEYGGFKDIADEGKYIDQIMREGFEWSSGKDKSEKAYQKWVQDHKDDIRGHIYDKLDAIEGKKVWRVPYIESQIFGGVTPADVSKIYTSNKKKLPKAWKETADKYNIRFEGPDGCYYNCAD